MFRNTHSLKTKEILIAASANKAHQGSLMSVPILKSLTLSKPDIDITRKDNYRTVSLMNISAKCSAK
jgi:hypothetical protein